jgi:hypothetical protein
MYITYTVMTGPTRRPETLVNNQKTTLPEHPEEPTQQFDCWGAEA